MTKSVVIRIQRESQVTNAQSSTEHMDHTGNLGNDFHEQSRTQDSPTEKHQPN